MFWAAMFAVSLFSFSFLLGGEGGKGFISGFASFLLPITILPFPVRLPLRLVLFFSLSLYLGFLFFFFFSLFSPSFFPALLILVYSRTPPCVYVDEEARTQRRGDQMNEENFVLRKSDTGNGDGERWLLWRFKNFVISKTLS